MLIENLLCLLRIILIHANVRIKRITTYIECIDDESNGMQQAVVHAR